MGLERYDLLRELGRGGMATVLLARQRDGDRLVALKELGGFNLGDPAMVERFMRESKVAGSISSEHIVAVLDSFEDAGTPYIAMELVEGGSLRPLVGQLSLPALTSVLEGILGAVQAAGRQGVVHRDLKPENVLLNAAGKVKVADFGIAKAGSDSSGSASNLTQAGMTVGTPAYMSPEQAMAGEVRTTSDLYAVGCMTYELLTGRVPFEGTSQMAVLQAHLNKPMPDVREVDPMIPEMIAEWVVRITAKDPDERFQTGEEAWAELEEAVIGQLGPLWRRDVVVEPASSLDLYDLPAMGPTPLRLTSPGQSAAPGGGFETYVAPAALHEQLEELRASAAAAQAVKTPEPVQVPVAAPAPAPEPEEVAPKPVAAPPRPVPRPATVAAQEEPRPLWWIPVVAAIALAAAFGVAFATGGPEDPVSVRADGLTLQAPAGWTAVDAGTVVPALGREAIALAPAGSRPGEAVVAARVRDTGAGLLPRALAGSVRGATVPVSLAAGQALRRQVVVDDKPLTTFSLATGSGAVVVACTVAPPVQADCADVAGSLAVTGRVQDLLPTAEGAQALSGALGRLRDAVRGPTQDIADARSRGAQGIAARDLSAAYATAAHEVGRAELGFRAAPAQARLVDALGDLGSGWRRYATAASGGDEGGVASARGSITTARARAGDARADLAQLGYGNG